MTEACWNAEKSANFRIRADSHLAACDTPLVPMSSSRDCRWPQLVRSTTTGEKGSDTVAGVAGDRATDDYLDISDPYYVHSVVAHCSSCSYHSLLRGFDVGANYSHWGWSAEMRRSCWLCEEDFWALETRVLAVYIDAGDTVGFAADSCPCCQRAGWNYSHGHMRSVGCYHYY